MNEFNQVANIKVFGIGGGGSNAVNRMVADGVKGVTFYIANTDVQVMRSSDCENKIILGRETTKGLGAGGNPEIGRKAAEETENEIREAIKGSDMVFLTAGLGGGTGTGAAPLFAKIAKEEGALTIGIVTKPFMFEGKKRERNAMQGLSELQKYTDSLIIVSNNNLLEVIGRKPIEEAFQAADNVLRQGVQTISDLIAVPALVNLDFADVRSVMQNQGAALIGIGMADGEDKAINAAEKAIQSPLLEAQITGAKSAIINITGGDKVSLYDAQSAVAVIQDAAGGEIDTIFGIAINEQLGDSIIVTVIATGFEQESEPQEPIAKSAPRTTASTVKSAASVRNEESDDDDLDKSIPSFFFNR